ncbi:MAG TPA: hypothetical protein VGS02_18700 [Acidobacteriaceae bacterium]|nr:hypothetical protein [Acidobacteriaceae bacterium]
MRRLTIALSLLVLLFIASALPARADDQSGPGTVTVILRDGHRQTFPLASVTRIEVTGSAPANLIHYPGPSRAHFLGKWEVGEGNGENFTIRLNDDGTAWRSLGDVKGTWQYINGEAQIRWDDGSDDCIRKVGAWFKKFYYHEDQAFSGSPENVTNARNLTQNPKGVD